MTQDYIVKYKVGSTIIQEKVLPGPFFMTTKALKIEEKGDNYVILIAIHSRNKEDDDENNLPDILVGSIPLLYFADERKTPALDYLHLTPPPPFQGKDIETMWDTIQSSDCPIPNTVSLQGQYAPGSASAKTGKHIVSEYLYYAHRQCSDLLARWPVTETYDIVRRNTELRGGREDFALTERKMGTLPFIETTEGKKIPLQTYRRIAGDEPWKSAKLRGAAQKLIGDFKTRFDQPLDWEARAFMTPFINVAKVANPHQPRIDPPVSTWPIDAKQCYESLLAARSVLNARDNGTVPTPLSLLWRLYEAWIASICFTAVSTCIGFPPIKGATHVKGCDWTTEWKLDGEVIVTLIAQPTITKNGMECIKQYPSRFLDGIHSISSNLIPDVLLIVASKKGLRLLLVDAKKRSLKNRMDSSQVAETGSKYIWGIRNKEKSAEILVNSVIVASTMKPTSMHSPESRIVTIGVLPNSQKKMDGTISQELDRYIRDLR